MKIITTDSEKVSPLNNPKDYWLIATIEILPDLLKQLASLEQQKQPVKRAALVARTSELIIKKTGFDSISQRPMLSIPNKNKWIQKQVEAALFHIIKNSELIEIIKTPFADERFKTNFFGDLNKGELVELLKAFKLTGLSNFRKENDNVWFVESLQHIIDEEIETSKPTTNIEKENVSTVDEWAPLPIEYNTPEVEMTIEKIEKAAKAIEADNGYSTTFPEERDGVVAVLKRSIADLHDQISFQKYYFEQTVIKPLSQAAKRLGGNAAGKAVEGALEAIKTLVKDFILDFFR